jgi:hypothetical protein
MVKFENPNVATAQVPQPAPIQNNFLQNSVRRTQPKCRIEPAKRSLLRRIRLKIGGKVADLFTW